MKKSITLLVGILLTLTSYAQAPEKMSYQAVVRDASNNLVVNITIGMQSSILQGSATGTEVYVETQNPMTNENGLISVEVGAGNVVTGVFEDIDWENGPYFIKTEFDIAGGTVYTIEGTSQLLSVPYALHAKTVEEKQTLSISFDTLSISGGNNIVLPSGPSTNNVGNTWVVLMGEITDAEAQQILQAQVGTGTRVIDIQNTSSLTHVDLSGFPDLELLSLEISNNQDLEIVNMPQVQSVWNGFTIFENPNLESLDLSQVSFTNGSVLIKDNMSLQELKIEELSTLRNHSLNVSNNPLLDDIVLPFLNEVSNIYIEGNSTLNTIDLSSVQILQDLAIGSNGISENCNMSNLELINGDLTIQSNEISGSLNLSNLEVISEDLTIHSNAISGNLDLSNLEVISEDLTIHSNAISGNLDVSNLEEISEDLMIQSNEIFGSLDLSNLEVISRDLTIQSNNGISGNLDLSNLGVISRDLTIQSNGISGSLNWSNLEVISRDLTIASNTDLGQISFTALENVNREFLIADNTNLSQIDCPMMESVGNGFAIKDNVLLTSVDFNSIVSIGTDQWNNSPFEISNNNSLIELDFPALVSIIGTLMRIENNNALNSLNFLSLSEFGSYGPGSVWIQNNNSLQSFSLPLIEELVNVDINFNSSLESVDFENLDAIGYGEISISENASLTDVNLSSLNYFSDFSFFDLSQNALSSNEVNELLANLIDAYIYYSTIKLEGQTPPAAPTGQGILDVQALELDYNMVTTD